MYSKVWSKRDWFLSYIGEPDVTIYGCTDPEADNYNPFATVDDDSCIYSYGAADFSFGNITDNEIQVIMTNDVPVGGFQFTLTDNPNLITLTGASGGSAAANGFEVSTSDLGIVIGFSFTGSTIPVGSTILTNLSYSIEDSGETSICLDEPIASDTDANPLTIDTIFCENIQISDVMLGDINNDATINIQDVVILINFVLGDDAPEGSEFYASDLNGDNTLNIQDIVMLINIILG